MVFINKIGIIKEEEEMKKQQKAGLEKPYMPIDIDEATQAFPGTVKHLMPLMEDIPEEFQHSRNQWNRLFSDMFYSGLSKLDMKPAAGIDSKKAFIHVRTIMGSYEPKHEHKEAACAYLLSLWFTDPVWEVNPRKKEA